MIARPTGLILIALLGACAGEGVPTEVDDSFTAARMISSETGQGATPMLTVLADGRPRISWVTDEGGGVGELRVINPGSGEAVGTLVDPLGGIDPHGEAPPHLAASQGGGLYSLYTVGVDVGQRYPASALRFSRSEDGGMTWSEPQSINEGEVFGSHSFHSVTAGPGEEVYAAWINNHPDEAGIWLRRSVDGGRTWLPSQHLVQQPACPCCRTAVAVDEEGRVYLAWRSISGEGVRDITIIRSTDHGATWQEPIKPANDNWEFNGCPHAGPSLVVDDAGTVHIGWWTGAPGRSGVWYASSTDRGASWAATPVDTFANAPVSHVQLLSRDGRVTIGWEGGPGRLPAVYLSERESVTGSFSTPVLLSDPTQAATFPVLATTGDSLFVAWTQIADAAYREHLEAHREPEGPDERMALPRVGQQEVWSRTGSFGKGDRE